MNDKRSFMLCIAVMALGLIGVANAQGTARASWQPPAVRVDDVAAVRLLWSDATCDATELANATNTVDVPTPTLEHTVNNLTPGTWCFVARTVYRDGSLSGLSNVASKVIAGAPPATCLPGPGGSGTVPYVDMYRENAGCAVWWCQSGDDWEQRAFCGGAPNNATKQASVDQLAGTKPAAEQWVVADTWRDTRPVYACDQACIDSQTRGRKIGDISKGSACNGPLTPAWESTRNRQYQFTPAGGVSLCERNDEP